MKNRAIVFAFILLILAVFLVSSVSAQTYSDVKFCKIYGVEADGQEGWGPGDRLEIADTCYKNLLMQGKDEIICEEIPTTATKPGCENVTFDYCNKNHEDPCCPIEVSTPEYTQKEAGDCYYGFAVAKLAPNLCSKSFAPLSCIYDIGLNSNNISDWMRAIGNSRFLISILVLAGALVFFFLMQRKNKILKNISLISMLIILLLTFYLSGTFASPVSGHRFSSAFIEFFKLGVGTGLLFYNLLLVPFFILGWSSLMKKIHKPRRKLYSFIYALVGGSVMSALIVFLTIRTFYSGPLGLEMLGFFMIAIILAALYTVMFSILFIANIKKVFPKDF
jgi:hypothetical protein